MPRVPSLAHIALRSVDLPVAPGDNGSKRINIYNGQTLVASDVPKLTGEYIVFAVNRYRDLERMLSALGWTPKNIP